MTLVEYQIQAGTTCGYGTFLPYVDGYPFSQPQAIYKLTSNAALGGSIELQTSSFPGAVAVVMDGCQSGAHLLTPLFSAVEGQGWTLPDSRPGDYYLMITASPALPDLPKICGNYALKRYPISSLPSAGSCAAPIRFLSGEGMSGNTCTATNTLPAIGQVIASPQNDLVYRFNRASMTTDRFYINSSGPNMLAVVQQACSTSSAALASVDIPSGGSTSLDVSNLPAGDLYLVITADPAGPATGCGSFGLTDLPPGVTQSSSKFFSLVQPGFYPEPFTTLPRGATPQRINFSGNGFAYSVTPQGANAALAVVTSMDSRNGKAIAVNASSAPRTMRMAFTGATVTAVGGLFGLTGLPNFLPPTTVTVSLRSGTRLSTFRLDGTGGFWGFSGTARIDEMTVSTSSGQGKPTVDNLVVGQAR